MKRSLPWNEQIDVISSDDDSSSSDSEMDGCDGKQPVDEDCDSKQPIDDEYNGKELSYEGISILHINSYYRKNLSLGIF